LDLRFGVTLWCKNFGVTER